MENDGNGMFYITENDENLAEMRIAVRENIITASHTEVLEKAEGKGLAKKLFQELVNYTREHKLTLNPLCPFVHAQLKRNPSEYSDIWKS